MGAPYEFNWYLVVADESEITKLSGNLLSTMKSEYRIYPVNSEIPLIIKNIGCVGIVKIVSFTVGNDKTEIKFEIVQNLNNQDPVSVHYNSMYKMMKQKNI